MAGVESRDFDSPDETRTPDKTQGDTAAPPLPAPDGHDGGCTQRWVPAPAHIRALIAASVAGGLATAVVASGK